MTAQSTRLRQLLADPAILVAPGAYDGTGARIAARRGFQALYVSGFATSAGVLGQPDVGYLTLTQMTDRVRTIADADTGYGNPLNVRQAVRAYEKTGAAAMHIEDQTFPKRCGHLRGRDVIASDEMVQKIKAAVDARCDPDFVIISRGAAYRDAGADMLFIESPENEEEMQRICDAFCGSIPVLSNQIEGGRTPMPGAKRLQEMGFALALFSVGTAFAAAKGMQDYLATLAATGDTRDAIDGMVVFDEFNQIIGLDEHAEPEQRYAPRQQ